MGPHRLGVLIDGARLNPYQNPDMLVPGFNPANYIALNAVEITDQSQFHVESIDEAASLRPDSLRKRRTTLSLVIHLKTEKSNRPTLARASSVTISLDHQDKDTADHNGIPERIGMFKSVWDQHQSLDFYTLYMAAVNGPEPHIHIQHLLLVISGSVANGEDLRSFLVAVATLESALKMMDTALEARTIPTQQIQALHTAWHQYVLTDRRPQFRAVGVKLQQADSAVRHFADDIIRRGAVLESLRPVCIRPPFLTQRIEDLEANTMERLDVVYTRIFQLRFIVKAYLQGVWE